MDTFGFLVGGPLDARWAVLLPWLPKVALLGVKNAVFSLTLIFWIHFPNKFLV